MTSSIFPPRSDFAPCSPITQLSASTTLDLPEPLGPTTQVIPGSKLRVVAEAKDLNPRRVRLLRYTTPGPSPVGTGSLGRAPSHSNPMRISARRAGRPGIAGRHAVGLCRPGAVSPSIRAIGRLGASAAGSALGQRAALHEIGRHRRADRGDHCSGRDATARMSSSRDEIGMSDARRWRSRSAGPSRAGSGSRSSRRRTARQGNGEPGCISRVRMTRLAISASRPTARNGRYSRHQPECWALLNVHHRLSWKFHRFAIRNAMVE